MDKSITRSRHPNSLAQAFLWALLSSFVLVLIAPAVGDAQVTVTTSITSTTGAGNLGTTVTHAGNLYNITGGTRPGNGPNLFHSFGAFSVGPGDIGNFLNNTGLPTSNILGRVTGGNISNIYGTIQTTNFGAANLFLINPSGIVFGPNGSVNVSGSVSFTTAQYLRLFDGVNSVNFYANPANDGLANSVLAVAPVVDFGFLSPAAYGFLTAPDPNASITVQGSALSVLSAPADTPPNSISLVGGKVVIEGGAHLSAPSGRILLATSASPGEFDVTTLASVPNVNGTSFTSFGSVSLAPGSSIDVSGPRTVFVKGGQLVLSVNDATLSTAESLAPQDTIALISPGSSIVTSNSGAEPGAEVQITVGTLQLDGAMVATINSGDGDGGNISIKATTVGLTNGASFLSSSGVDFTTGTIVGFGNGGNVTVQGLQGPGSPADSVALTNGSTITTLTFGPGRGGDVQLTARTLTMEDRSAIFTGNFVDGDGIGGDVVLNVGTVSLMGGSSIESQSQSVTPGLGHGNLTIQGLPGAEFGAAESVTLSGGSIIKSTTFGLGDGGQVAITAKSLTMEGADTTVKASTTDVGHGGDIVVRVQHASLLEGATITTLTGSADPNAPAAATVTVQGLNGHMADSVALSGFGSGIISETTGAARSGHVTVESNTVSLTNGAVIQTGTLGNVGAGGDVTINAGSVDISSGSRISSLSAAENAGQVAITANALTLNNGSIDTFTSSSGRGGDVVLNVGTVSLSNGTKIDSASTGTTAIPNPDGTGTTKAPGAPGNIIITASGGFTSDASTVVTSAEANHGGDISITAQNVQLSGGTLITANSKAPLQVTEIVLVDGQLVPQVVGNGNAGNITIHSGSNVVMNNSSMTTEASQASGGKIEITAPEMVQLINSRVSTSVAGSATDTAGGNITIDPQFVILQNGQILAKAFAGTGGNITITSNVFLADPNSLVDASSQLGISGEINIQSPVQNVGGQLTPMSQQFSSAAALLTQQCAARAADGKFSTFVVAGRESLPMEPGGFLASPSLTAELFGSSLSGRDPHTQFSAVTGLFPEYDARPIQLAKFGNACHQ